MGVEESKIHFAYEVSGFVVSKSDHVTFAGQLGPSVRAIKWAGIFLPIHYITYTT